MSLKIENIYVGIFFIGSVIVLQFLKSLKYDGNIPMICRWAQELLGYQFSIIHCHKRMMVDVDSLTRRFGPLIAYHCFIAAILYCRDKQHRSIAYQASSFHSSATANIIPPDTVLQPTYNLLI